MELYLSRIILNVKSKAVMNDLSSPRELHKTLSGLFPAIDGQREKPPHERETPRDRVGLLHRLDQKGESSVLYVQSNIRPDWQRLTPGYAIRCDDKQIDPFYAAIKNGDQLHFRLTANPTKRAGRSDAGNGKFQDPKKRRRIDIRTEPERLKWLQRKGEACGFRLLTVQPAADVYAAEASTGSAVRFRHDRGSVTLGTAVFEGLLEVTDADAFRLALANGIGPGKAYGFGLMSVARA